LNYSVSEKNENTEIRVSGRLNKGAVIASGNFIRSLIDRGASEITLNIDGLDDDREMVYHIALINSFKKETERANKIFKLVSTRSSIQKYLSITGLSMLFPVSMENTAGEEF